VAQLAAQLRELRDQMGEGAPTVDQISAREGVPRSTLYAALKGSRLPSRDVLSALVRSWGGDVAEWLAKRSAIELEPAKPLRAQALQLFADDPAEVDLLGFAAIVDALEDTLTTGRFDTLTVGIAGPWGSGKTSVMNMLKTRLSKHSDYSIVEVNPWQYEDSPEMQATLAGKVVEEIKNHFQDSESDQRHVTSEPEHLSMAGFSDGFAALLARLTPIRRVIIFVDNLDRCLPGTLMATFDLIHRYLAVPKTAFVLTVDQQLLHKVLTKTVGGDESLASAYLTKLLQLVVPLPEFTHAAAAEYLRRLWHHTTLAELADQVSAGAIDVEIRSPRQIKRLANQLLFRVSIAQRTGADITHGELVKLFLLETRFPDQFRRLMSMTDEQQQNYLRQWENWAHGRRETAPEGVSTETRHWASSAPELSGRSVSRYLALAASMSGLSAPNLTGHDDNLLGSE
jgi:hypothetical protein